MAGCLWISYYTDCQPGATSINPGHLTNVFFEIKSIGVSFFVIFLLYYNTDSSTCMAAWLMGTFTEGELGASYSQTQTALAQASPAVDELTLPHTSPFALALILGSYENADKLKGQCSRKFRITYPVLLLPSFGCSLVIRIDSYNYSHKSSVVCKTFTSVINGLASRSMWRSMENICAVFLLQRIDQTFLFLQ